MGKVVPKPTEAVKIIPAPVTEPVRPFIPIFESYSSTTPNPTTTVTTTTTTTTKTTTYPYTKPVVFKDLSETFVKPVTHQEPVLTHYETPVSHPVESDYETPSHSAETHYETPSHSAETHYETPSHSADTQYETPSYSA